MYKYELHCHTGSVSLCATIPPKDLVRKYEEAGYSGLVLTDHYSPMTFMLHHYLRPQSAMEYYLSAYRELRDQCGDSFTVLLGLELRRYAAVNDYLVYGVEEDWLRRQPNMLLWNEKKLYTEAHRAGCLVYQAHPYRRMVHRCDPRYLDGIEVFNGHTDEERNQKALRWAQSLNKPMTSGSDTHHLKDAVCGGIGTETPIRTNADLLDVLRSGRYSLLTPESDAGE
ncbi:MAG: PHP domain-containing protein [Clostridia bacterium]|nr:PHP domain-containing protein [Clostridia bacterium]